MHRISLGIDTSNYKTSVAMVNQEGRILCNLQKYLEVKKGERGLRQSVALFQHVNNLPQLIEEAFSSLGGTGTPAEIGCISVSARPRPVEGSYMPCFQAGLSSARQLAAALKVPCYTFSHQEGHIEAVRFGSPLEKSRRFISFHFSGGTTEALLAEEGSASWDLGITIVGGSKDLALGQVLDRTGVAMGMEFPCGQAMDHMVRGLEPTCPKDNLLPKIKCQDGLINLSGIETKCQRLLGQVPRQELTLMLFTRLAEAVADMSSQLSDIYNTKDILFAGGVSASRFIRDYLSKALAGLHICFGEPALCTDNAVGIALLGGKKYGSEACNSFTTE